MAAEANRMAGWVNDLREIGGALEDVQTCLTETTGALEDLRRQLTGFLATRPAAPEDHPIRNALAFVALATTALQNVDRQLAEDLRAAWAAARDSETRYYGGTDYVPRI